MEYRIREIRVNEDTGDVGIVLEKPGKAEGGIEDGFAIWIPEAEFDAMTESDLEARIKAEVQKRTAKLKEIELKKQEAKARKQKAMAKVEALKGRIFKPAKES